MMVNCFVPGCGHTTFKSECSFFSLPKDEKTFQKWKKLLRFTMRDFKQLVNPRVCSCHFFNHSKENLPTLRNVSAHAKKMSCDNSLLSIKRRKRDPSLVLNDVPTVDDSELNGLLVDETKNNENESLNQINALKNELLHFQRENEDLRKEVELLKSQLEATNIKMITNDASTSTKLYTRYIATQTSFPKSRINYDSLTDSELQYATGFERDRFMIIYDLLKRYCPISENVVFSSKDALLITLFKIRHNQEFKMIEFSFGISRVVVSATFTEVVEKLYSVLKQINIWNISYQDSNTYRCILDCIEFGVSGVNDPNMQQLLYSIHKDDYTFKVMVSCDENGGVNFISDTFVGSTSDREIFVKSGISDKLNSGDAIMADRGFDISGLLEEKGVVLNIPPFMRGKDRLSAEEVMTTRIIANKRILIQHVNARAKKNKIISDRISTSLWPISNKLIYICYAFINFYKPLRD